MKKFIILFLIILLLPCIIIGKDFELLRNITSGSSGESDEFSLAGLEVSKKVLLGKVSGSSINMTITIWVGLDVKLDNSSSPTTVFSPTTTLTLTGTESALLNNGDSIPNPFFLVNSNKMNKIKVTYTRTSGKINYVSLTTS